MTPLSLDAQVVPVAAGGTVRLRDAFISSAKRRLKLLRSSATRLQLFWLGGSYVDLDEQLVNAVSEYMSKV